MTTDIVLKLTYWPENQRYQALKWLSTVPYLQHHEETRRLRYKGTGEWMLRKVSIYHQSLNQPTNSHRKTARVRRMGSSGRI
jgi:hypothetical protein